MNTQLRNFSLFSIEHFKYPNIYAPIPSPPNPQSSLYSPITGEKKKKEEEDIIMITPN